jgi:hypothetical protein
MSFTWMPARWTALWVAGMTPLSMMTGSTPAVTVETIFARFLRPYFLHAASLAMSTAAAPSEICELLPAWTTPFALKTVGNVASFSSDVVARGPSSFTNGRFCPSGHTTSTEAISRSNSPFACAARARWWLSNDSSSSSVRESFHFSAMSSALIPCVTKSYLYSGGAGGQTFGPTMPSEPIGMRLMISTPQPTVRSACPAMMACAA